ncbi:MAG: trypsin-like peptidase domain-containing protein [Oscillospiraceae bacterium]|nr:trypsin-like peptidase domain-containing protein [Oscillospiraceae bacterium]
MDDNYNNINNDYNNSDEFTDGAESVFTPAEETVPAEAASDEDIPTADEAEQPIPEAAPAEQPQADCTVVCAAPAAAKAAKKQRMGVKMVALALVCAILGGVVGAGGVTLVGSLGEDDGSAVAAAASIEASTIQEGTHSTGATVVETASVTTGAMTASEVYAANVNSTVGITTSITTNFFGYQTTSAASGSGFIITSDGYILTNEHVIEDASSITVTLYDGTAYDAELVGYDTSNDIAVLKIDAAGLTPVTIGDSDALSVGEDVVAIGNPLGELTFSLTKGVVSALNREVTMSTGVTMTLIQTDCAINSGNSGGALFNMYGEVIGITNGKYSSSGSSTSIDNIGFAIPINSVMDIVESIIENGYVVKPYIGVYVGSVSTEAQSYGVPAGAVISSVVEGAPAEAAGLQTSDVIFAVNGTSISSSSELVEIVGNASVGEELTLSVYRQGEELTLTLTVGETRESALPETETADTQTNGGMNGRN